LGRHEAVHKIQVLPTIYICQLYELPGRPTNGLIAKWLFKCRRLSVCFSRIPETSFTYDRSFYVIRTTFIGGKALGKRSIVEVEVKEFAPAFVLGSTKSPSRPPDC